MGGKIIPRIRLTSAKVLVEVELCNNEYQKTIKELKIANSIYTGRNYVVNAIEEKLKHELEAYG